MYVSSCPLNINIKRGIFFSTENLGNIVPMTLGGKNPFHNKIEHQNEKKKKIKSLNKKQALTKIKYRKKRNPVEENVKVANLDKVKK